MVTCTDRCLKSLYSFFFLYLEGLKRGICPIPLPVDSCEGETDDECTLDSDCFGDKKCCSDSCQKLCVQPPQSKCYLFSRQARTSAQATESKYFWWMNFFLIL